MSRVPKIDKSTWQTVRFGDVAREVKDTEQDPLAKGITRYVGLADLDPDSIQLKRWSEIADSETTFTRLFCKGQMLFGRRRAYQRKAAVAPFDGICSGDIIVMEAKPDKLLPELLPFLIHTDGFFDYAIQTSAGSLSPRTKWSHLAKYEFALPPLDEQRRIAEVLTAVEESLERYNGLIDQMLWLI
jgi:type I restriction enzyme, S subunit